MAPAAARYAGFSSRRALWLALLVSGGAAGLAGALEVAGPIGQLTLSLPAGYGFAAIIVAFVGRLHPVGVVFSSILMSMLYIGGELAQSRLGLPKSISLVFQGLLLFTLLACDTLIHSHWRRVGARAPKGAAPEASGTPADKARATDEADETNETDEKTDAGAAVAAPATPIKVEQAKAIHAAKAAAPSAASVTGADMSALASGVSGIAPAAARTTCTAGASHTAQEDNP